MSKTKKEKQLIDWVGLFYVFMGMVAGMFLFYSVVMPQIVQSEQTQEEIRIEKFNSYFNEWFKAMDERKANLVVEEKQALEIKKLRWCLTIDSNGNSTKIDCCYTEENGVTEIVDCPEEEQESEIKWDIIDCNGVGSCGSKELEKLNETEIVVDGNFSGKIEILGSACFIQEEFCRQGTVCVIEWVECPKGSG